MPQAPIRVKRDVGHAAGRGGGLNPHSLLEALQAVPQGECTRAQQTDPGPPRCACRRSARRPRRTGSSWDRRRSGRPGHRPPREPSPAPRQATRRGSGTSCRPPSRSTGAGDASGRRSACGTAGWPPTSPSTPGPRATRAGRTFLYPRSSAPTPGSCRRRNASSMPPLPPGSPTSPCHHRVVNIHSWSRSPA